MKTKLKKWKKISSKKVYEGYFNVLKDVVLLPNKKKYNYYLSGSNKKSVIMFPVDSKGRILLTKEYRYPVDKVIYQSIGGTVEKNETPLHAAKRELVEETGFRAKKIKLLGNF